MKKTIIALAAVAAISFSMPSAHAFDASEALEACEDEDEVAECIKSITKGLLSSQMQMPKMPGMPKMRKGDARAMAQRGAAARIADETEAQSFAPAKLGGPVELRKKYISSIGQMIDVGCD